VETRGERFVLQLGSESITDRGIAGELLIRLGDRSKGLVDDRVIGRFAGFELLVSPMLGSEVQLLLRGSAKHPVRIQATAQGTTRALEHIVNNLEEYVSQAEETLGQPAQTACAGSTGCSIRRRGKCAGKPPRPCGRALRFFWFS